MRNGVLASDPYLRMLADFRATPTARDLAPSIQFGPMADTLPQYLAPPPLRTGRFPTRPFLRSKTTSNSSISGPWTEAFQRKLPTPHAGLEHLFLWSFSGKRRYRRRSVCRRPSPGSFKGRKGLYRECTQRHRHGLLLRSIRTPPVVRLGHSRQ